MRKLFTAVMAVLMVSVTVQFFLAASGASDSRTGGEAFDAHRGLGFVILLLALVAVVIAVLVRAPGRVTTLTGTLVGLLLLQPILAGVSGAIDDSGGGSQAAGLVFGLHGVNGLAIAALIGVILKAARTGAAADDPSGPAVTTRGSGEDRP